MHSLEGPTRFELVPQGFAVPRITVLLWPHKWLPSMDSNHDSQSQNLASYR